MSDIKSRIWGLDLLRAIAIVFVLIFHWLAFNLTGPEYSGIIYYSSILGYLGVEFFFVLSGFLIGGIIIKLYYTEAFTIPTVWNFWVRRWLRTLPLYYFILLVYILYAQVKHTPVSGLWKYIFFVQNFFEYDTHNNDFYGVSWSLSIEEWFYLSFPIALYLIHLGLRNSFSKRTILLTTILFYLLLPLLVRFFFAYTDESISWKSVLRKAVVCREDAIAFGVLGAFLFQYVKDKIYANKSYLFAAGSIILTSCSLVFILEIAKDYFYNSGGVSFFSKTALFSLVNLGVLMMLPVFYYAKEIGSGFAKAVSYVSRISYSLYLNHMFAILLVNKLLKVSIGTQENFYLIINFVLFATISIFSSDLTYKYIEQTFLNLRDRPKRINYKKPLISGEHALPN